MLSLINTLQIAESCQYLPKIERSPPFISIIYVAMEQYGGKFYTVVVKAYSFMPQKCLMVLLSLIINYFQSN